jgi:hypothetical protein
MEQSIANVMPIRPRQSSHWFMDFLKTNQYWNFEFFILITDTDTDGHRYVLLVTDTLYCSLLHLCAKIKNILDLMNPYR